MASTMVPRTLVRSIRLRSPILPLSGRLSLQPKLSNRSPSSSTNAIGARLCSPAAAAFHTSAPRRLASDSSANSADPKAILPEFSLKDKVIIVSGGAQGLGLTQAEALLEAGAIVHALDRQPTPSPAFTSLAARSSPDTLHYHPIDVRDTSTLNTTIASIATRHSRLDGLIAAAGIQRELPALDYTPALSNEMFAVNVTGVFMTAQAVARQVLRLEQASGASIVLIASMSGTVANKGLICPAYNASKAAVQQLGRNLAMEWGKHGIRVNTISPGYIVTEMVDKLFETHPERREKWSGENMLGRLSSPREFRGAAVFLLSEASSFMTGSDLRIDGGHCAW